MWRQIVQIKARMVVYIDCPCLRTSHAVGGSDDKSHNSDDSDGSHDGNDINNNDDGDDTKAMILMAILKGLTRWM